MNIKITTQAELDALPLSFSEHTVIEIHGGTYFSRIQITKARENSSVEARGNSSVVAWGNSSVEAWENSSDEAWGNSSVEARGNSSVEAWGNSSVVAWGNSSVVAWENCGVHIQSDFCAVELFGFAVAWLVAKAAKAKKSSKTATIITPTKPSGTDEWIESQAINPNPDSKTIVLFKRVSSGFKTHEGTQNETLWSVGSKVDHPSWNPTNGECGAGKFHACSRPYFCDEFRDKKGDVYVAIEVSVKDLYVWPDAEYPHKIAFRSGTVLHVCNKFGKKLP